MNLKRLGRAVGLLAALTLASPAATHAEDIVRIASAYRTTTLDPALSAAAGNIETYGQLYGRLIRRAADGSLEPGLAESWAVSDDGKTVTLKIRDAKFSDGSPITADDVVFSLLRVRDLKESAYSAPLQQLAEAKAGDAQTVILTLKSAFAPFVGNLEVFNTGIVSQKDVETRLAIWLLKRCPQPLGPATIDIKLDVTKTVLASELRIRNETLSRTIARMRDLGLVVSLGRTIRVTDPLRLLAWLSGAAQQSGTPSGDFLPPPAFHKPPVAATNGPCQ